MGSSLRISLAALILLSPAIAGAGPLCVRNDSEQPINSSALDYDAAFCSVSDKGEVVTLPILSLPWSITWAEDDVALNGRAGILMLGQRSGDITNATSTDGDYANMKVEDGGRVYANRLGNTVSKLFDAANGADVTGTTAEALILPNLNKRYYISAISCTNTSANGSRLSLLSDSTEMWSGYLPIGSGSKGKLIQRFPIPLRAALNAGINFQLATASTATRCAINGFTTSE